MPLPPSPAAYRSPSGTPHLFYGQSKQSSRYHALEIRTYSKERFFYLDFIILASSLFSAWPSPQGAGNFKVSPAVIFSIALL